MRALFASLSLLVIVALVPVSAWATAEPDAGSTVSASSDVSNNTDLADSSVAESEPWSYPYPSITPEPVTSDPDDTAQSDAGSDEWSVYELTAVETIWDKPFEEYTPTEGYLFLIFTLILVYLGFRIFKGGVL